jgi:hypothetical protein
MFSSTAIEIIYGKFFAVAKAKVFPFLRPGNTAFKGQLRLVYGFERKYQTIHGSKKTKKNVPQS